ncbi:MAG: hypothetical protein ACJ8M4_11440 [Chthoniobacterales bacterium]
MKRFLPVLVLFLTVVFARAGALDETARFLAGIHVPGSYLEPLTRDPAWLDHARALDSAWVKKDYHQVRPIRAWMLENAPEIYTNPSPVFYMFGGPDFLYANLFYPQAKTYILAGLEPVGTVPDLSKMDINALRTDLNALRASMHTVLQTHYFITKDMRAELTRPNLGGTLPILYVFLARLGCTVVDTTYIKTPADGVRITFTTRGGPNQTLYYFKTDLSGGPSPFLKWCAGQGPGNSLLKAASYLMHTEGFAGVRNFLLNNSRVIIQDDSGIPLRAFPKNWKVDFYGHYVPHEEFLKYQQPDLAAIYNRQPPPPDLGFAFGYHWQKDRGLLMLATRK